MIFLAASFLQKINHPDCERGQEYHVNTIYKLERGHAYRFILTYSVYPKCINKLLVPTTLVRFQHLFDNIDKWFIWGFHQYITLWIIFSWVPHVNLIFISKFNHSFRFKSYCIISDHIVWIAQMGQNIIFKKLNDCQISSLSSGNHLNPFSEIVCFYEDLLVLC